MPENKLGNINIADEVIAIIAGMSTVEIEGIYSMSGGFAGSLANMLGRKNLSRGVKVNIAEDKVQINLYIVIKYESSIPDIAWKIQDNVKSTVEGMTGLEVTEVNVHVQGVEFPDQAEEENLVETSAETDVSEEGKEE